MSYNLFLDDERNPEDIDNTKEYIIARSSKDAIGIIMKKGIPNFIAFNYYLGINYSFSPPKIDTCMKFLESFYRYCESLDSYQIPDYSVHTSDNEKRYDIIVFMEMWKNERKGGKNK